MSDYVTQPADDGLSAPTPPPAMDARKAVVVALIDETGSMMGIADETVSGVNAFFQTLKDTLGADEAFVSALLFCKNGNDPITRPVFEPTNIGSWEPMPVSAFKPRGFTPLYDAIAVAIEQAEIMVTLCRRLEGEDRRVVLVVQTDGQENRSRLHNRADIAARIAAKRHFGWEIIFLGADLPEVGAMGRDIGTQDGSTMSYDAGRSAEMFGVTASNTTGFIRGQRVNASYTVGQRDEFEQQLRPRPKPRRL